jgi:hypothetical protein
MMMYHHDNRSYQVAASAAADNMKRKLEERIEAGRAQSTRILERIDTEIPQDRIVRGDRLTFDVVNGKQLGVSVGGNDLKVHPHALGQLLSHAGVPKNFLDSLMTREVMDEDKGVGDRWGAKLGARMLSEIYAHDHDRHLFRSVGDQLRGALSPRYDRRDTRVILQHFLEGCQRVGAMPYESAMSDTRVMMKVIIARLIEPVKNEIVLMGAVFEDSQYGNGATSVSTFIERAWCTNLAVSTTQTRRIHLSKELTDADVQNERTMQLRTDLFAEETRNAVMAQLGDNAINNVAKAVQDANEAKISPTEIDGFLKRRLTAGQAEKVQEIFNSADVLDLPAGQSRWRLSNALSFYAHSVTDPEQKLEVQRLAGEAMTVKPAKGEAKGRKKA